MAMHCTENQARKSTRESDDSLSAQNLPESNDNDQLDGESRARKRTRKSDDSLSAQNLPESNDNDQLDSESVTALEQDIKKTRRGLQQLNAEIRSIKKDIEENPVFVDDHVLVDMQVVQKSKEMGTPLFIPIRKQHTNAANDSSDGHANLVTILVHNTSDLIKGGLPDQP